MSPDQKPARIHSMDQFRGYTVAGMFLVNFVGSLAAFHYVVKHNSGFFSYADSIMPSFIFCAGFSYRLTAVRRFSEMGAWKASLSYIRRSLALVLVSVAIYSFNSDIGKSWVELENSVGVPYALSEFVFKFLKSGMWEVLGIIGMTQILILPFINRSVSSRVIAIIALPLLHVVLSWSFNYEFANGLPNWFNMFFGRHNGTVWDGGLFGPLSWSLPMLAGALTYDLIANRTAPKACGALVLASFALMAGGYLTNCLSRLYDTNPALQASLDIELESLEKQKAESEEKLAPIESEIKALEEAAEESEDEAPPSNELIALRKQAHVINVRLKGIKRKSESVGKIALDPVIPSMERLRTAEWGWADLPFIKPEREQQKNYWLMDKGRMTSLPFTLFSTGFGLFLYAVFIVAVDVGGLQIGVFKTLGQNPLAAYIIHGMLEHAFHGLTPKDSPLWWGMLIFCVFFMTTLVMVRYLEKNRLFLRL